MLGDVLHRELKSADRRSSRSFDCAIDAQPKRKPKDQRIGALWPQAARLDSYHGHMV